MTYFTSDYLQFFKDLAPNNNKEWFDANRKRYEEVVREPFKLFVTDLIEEVAKKDPEIQITQKEAIFRINRDIRFSKDKTPYKTNNSALISKNGRKDKTYPGIYVELGPEKLGIYGGVFMPDSKQVARVREYLADNLETFEKAINEKSFKSLYGEIKGEQAKRIPKELKDAAAIQPLLFNKQWYYFAHLDPKTIESSSLMNTILKHYEAAASIRTFLTKALY